jgi:hypothetical protein
MPRYKIVEGWFDGMGSMWKVVDTQRTGDWVCVSYEEGDAMMIADALNKADM